MDIFRKLKSDHTTIKGLLKELCKNKDRSAKERRELFHELNQVLLSHTKAEEEVFYSKFFDDQKFHRKILHSKEEHHIAENLLREIAELAKMTVLRETIEDHIEDEEDELFDKARRLLKDEKDDLGEMMANKMKQYQTDIRASA